MTTRNFAMRLIFSVAAGDRMFAKAMKRISPASIHCFENFKPSL
jgi:hypothetical protein